MIEESSNKVKGEDEAVIEEEFDIVPVGEKPKKSLKSHVSNVSLIFLVAFASFGLGRLTIYEERSVPVEIKFSQAPSSILQGSSEVVSETGEVRGVSTTGTEVGGEVVASKSGKKYHYPWCAGAKQIADKNKITFASTDEARKAGYTPAANCKGLK